MSSLPAAQLPAEAPAPPRTVHLDGVADLEHLRETNLFHYLRAKRILADPQCGSMWMTSLPPTLTPT